jgi:hypothetical protein
MNLSIVCFKLMYPVGVVSRHAKNIYLDPLLEHIYFIFINILIQKIYIVSMYGIIYFTAH